MKNGAFSVWVIVWLWSFVFMMSACHPRTDTEASVNLELWTIALKPKFIAYFDNLLAQFEAEHPEVKVRWLDLPQASILPKLMASIAGGVPPDVVNLSTGTALTLARNGALVNMEESLSPQVVATFHPQLWRAASWRGGIYAVPWYVTTRVLIYNKQILQQSGWNVASPPRTWKQVEELAVRVRRQGGSVYGYEPVVRLIDDWRMAGLPVYSQDGLARFNTVAGQSCLRWYVELRRRDLIPAETLIEGYAGAIDRYKQGNLALLEAGPQLLLNIAADAPEVYAHTGVSSLPLGSSGTLPAALMDLVVPRSSQHRQLAVQLAAFIANKQNQLAFVREVPLLPSTIVSEAEMFPPEVRAGDALQAQALRLSFAQLQRAEDFSLGLERARELEKTINKAVESAFYGQCEVPQALGEAEREWNEIVLSSSFCGRSNE